jgi:hypothetical protein
MYKEQKRNGFSAAAAAGRRKKKKKKKKKKKNFNCERKRGSAEGSIAMAVLVVGLKKTNSSCSGADSFHFLNLA